MDRISPIIEGRSRTQTIKIELDNKEGILKPGMFVRALISTYEKKDALVIPASALKKKENEYITYAIQKEEAKSPVSEAKEKPRKSIWPFNEKKAKPAEVKPVPEKPVELGTIEIRKVKTGYMTQDLVQIDEGLQEDELIVTEIQEDFKDKAKVEISEVQEGLI